MNEVWKPVLGYEGIYEVSNLGRVRSLDRVITRRDGVKKRASGCVIVGSVSSRGYRCVTLVDLLAKRITHRVHRLVADAFCENPEGKPFVNHIDANKANNEADNLEWCTPQENVAHASDNDLWRPALGDCNGKSKLSESDVVDIRAMAASGVMLKTIAAHFGISPSVVSNICARKAWKHVT